ncbi:bifunctional 5,10-methylenetetrahydrofolate dehydrogenase/5,10-methenyltetrahydrofolate cyclohydrolase [[Clostridium] scindens]|uniref:bifunctional 5,10-methylenetetrahydrofolate dehydrogenase/5,10-methenyltetrahydrofolate cyclohydrolase n=1 Tax=Clostridium scindens (strain JCM 10418 / VPI 12708) TaxID=29347 RepID=UPI001FCAA815|nr:bifunctional 5,10-methylenetetrahydrofolate dehydrogenase/5,10-methenyltetrahydrofolate cyclohydrolase [[Clostridium] scindens]WPB38484.1 Bifunctional protein FolD protein [[Clostridium] scindens]BDF16826.1 bifunctional protein FolD [[Clostridium] scindens]BDF20525.1 bifunctional protein FolD [[Clostridium] scindens]
MSILMKGADVAKTMKEDLTGEARRLKDRGILPSLTIVRVGARPDDLAYERGARKRMEMIGIECKVVELPETITQAEFEKTFFKINEDPKVHGILLFRPLPGHLDEGPVVSRINPLKDVDCMCPVNIAKVFSGDETGHAPCTPEAVMEMLDYYKIDPRGKKVTVIGRSMVVGKPLSMMLLKRHATVTICHTRTKDLTATCREAEILVAAAGKARMVTADMIGDGAVVVDVGINVDAKGNLCGDVDFNAAEPVTSYISPVPRGVGSVTSSVLAKHVLKAAEYLSLER